MLWQFHYFDKNKEVDPEMYVKFISKYNLEDIEDVTDHNGSKKIPSLRKPRFVKTISIEKFIDRVIEYAEEMKDEVEE